MYLKNSCIKILYLLNFLACWSKNSGEMRFLLNKIPFFKNKTPLLLTPGPVMLNPSVQKSLSQNMWHHRSQEFKQILNQVRFDLKEIFQTREDVLILNSTGTGAMEALISNTLSPGDEILCVCAGKFGERWRDIAKTFGIKVSALDVPWGQAVALSDIQKKLDENQMIKAVLVTACETSTATEQPIKQIAELLKNYSNTCLFVDGMTGLGAMELKMDEWGLSALIAGSQKSFMLPTGLAFVCLSQEAWKLVDHSSCPKYYFDLKKEREAQAGGQTAFSSSVTLIRALKESLDLIKQQGLKASILRCQTLKKAVLAFCESLNLPIYSSHPANSVTAIFISQAERIKNCLEKNSGIVFAGGQGELKNKILRIGHLGPLSGKDMMRALKALAWEIKKTHPQLFNDKQIGEALKKAKRVLRNSKI